LSLPSIRPLFLDIQKRLFLRHVQPGGHTAFMPGIHQLQTFLQRLHGAIQDSQLGIELSQGEIIACNSAVITSRTFSRSAALAW